MSRMRSPSRSPPILPFWSTNETPNQRAYGFTCTDHEGAFEINYPGPANAPATPQLDLEIANNKAQPVFLGKTDSQPQAGVATYLDVTLPTGEPIVGDPPKEIRAIAMPDTGTRSASGQVANCRGDSHSPEAAEAKIASMTAMFLIASSTGTGISPPSRTAFEKASPCKVY
jgi:hypothetical protein